METEIGVSLLSSAVVAAVVAAVVSLATVWINGRRERRDRQRLLFAEAFEAVVSYREFAYIVRRRDPKDPEGERLRISTGLSEVQRRLANLEARLRVEAPRVGEAYSRLVAETRPVAGRSISSGWKKDPIDADAEMGIADVDYGSLRRHDEQFLLATRDHLGGLPRARRWWRETRTKETPG